MVQRISQSLTNGLKIKRYERVVDKTKGSMRHGSLFSGIGGFDLAAQWMGWENVFQVEIDPFCQNVLAKNFPTVARYGDIKQFEGTKYRGTIDILTGGFPCQPYSSSGKRKGKEDHRHLWPEMLRVIRDVQPTYIVAENVYGLFTWSKGMVFEQVHSEMEASGYQVQSFIIPACGVQAPHERARVWFVAYANSKHRALSAKQWKERQTGDTDPSWFSECESFTNSYDRRLSYRNAEQIQKERDEAAKRFRSIPSWEDFPTQHPIRRRDDGVSNRMDRFRAIGNAIVPQVAFEIFKAIEQVSLSI